MCDPEQEADAEAPEQDAHAAAPVRWDGRQPLGLRLSHRARVRIGFGRDRRVGLRLLFLRLLEETYGRAVFDSFLKSWFQQQAFTSVTTANFLAFLEANLIDKHKPQGIRPEPDLKAWIEQPGLPADAPRPHSEALQRVDAALRGYLEGRLAAQDMDTSEWLTQHWLHFLRAIPDDLRISQIAELEDAFAFTNTGNSEILAQWLIVTIRHGYGGTDQRMEEFLIAVGRRKFLKPIYEELVKTPEGHERARQIYEVARPGYHSISQRSLDEVILP